MAGSKPSTDRSGWACAAVERFEGPLVRFAVRIVGDVETAREIVQETFLKLCRQDRERVEPHLAEWLFTVCRNGALDVLRKEGRVSRSPEAQDRLQLVPSADEPAEDRLERREEFDRVLECLDGLPMNQREVIRLRFQNEFSYQEISRITGLSVSNVGYLLHVGLKTLRNRLAADADRSEASTRRGLA